MDVPHLRRLRAVHTAGRSAQHQVGKSFGWRCDLCDHGAWRVSNKLQPPHLDGQVWCEPKGLQLIEIVDCHVDEARLTAAVDCGAVSRKLRGDISFSHETEDLICPCEVTSPAHGADGGVVVD